MKVNESVFLLPFSKATSMEMNFTSMEETNYSSVGVNTLEALLLHGSKNTSFHRSFVTSMEAFFTSLHGITGEIPLLVEVEKLLPTSISGSFRNHISVWKLPRASIFHGRSPPILFHAFRNLPLTSHKSSPTSITFTSFHRLHRFHGGSRCGSNISLHAHGSCFCSM